MINYNDLKKNLGSYVPKGTVLNMLSSMQNRYQQAFMNDGRALVVGKVYRPNCVKKYDIVANMVASVPHPCIVYKVDKDFVYSLCLSSTAAAHNVFKLEESRIFRNTWMTNSVVRQTHESALESFIGIIDNKKEIDKGFRHVRGLYKDIFRF